MTASINFDFYDGLFVSERVEKGRTIFVVDGLSAGDFKPDVPVKDAVSLYDKVTLTKAHWLDDVIPQLDIYVWNPAEVSPSGRRHIGSGIGLLHTLSSQGFIDFGNRDNETEITSQTRVLTAKVIPTSGVMGVTNMKVWLPQYGNFLPSDLNINYQSVNGSGWQQGRTMPSGTGYLLSNSLPLSQNLFREDGSPFLDGANVDGTFPSQDHNTSQFMYMSVNTSLEYTAGNYTFPTDDIQLRITYDYYIGGYHADASGVT